MELSLFFNPLNEEDFSSIKDQNSFLTSITINYGPFPDLKGKELAIIGLEEDRGNSLCKDLKSAAVGIRKKLYKLKKGTGTYKVVDLGNLKNGVDHEETRLRIKEICFILIEMNILPVLIGGSHDLDYGQYRAYDGLDKMITILNVDARVDIEDGKEVEKSDSHVQEILLHEPNYLFNYCQLAYQSYLVDPNAINVLEKLNFESYRLGFIRNNIQNMEPIIRDADMLTFDCSALKSSDFPASSNSFPFGLTGEEACQICWYAGLNEKLSSAGFYEFDPTFDDDSEKSAWVVATMVWYFIEGVCHRRYDHNFKTNDYIKYVVSLQDNDPESLVFYKSIQSEKWWMEVPYSSKKGKYHRNRIIPCSYSDYETANSGEVPDRWITMQAKLI
ncbi:MAG: formimidoylglutamase [Bacteroidota bacterium]